MAYIGAEDYRIVRHTHDVELATQLMTERLRAELREEYWPDPAPPTAFNLGTPKKVYVRIQGAIPGSQAEAEGWSYAYHEYSEPGRGAFPAVVFR